MKFPTIKEMAEEAAKKALDEFEYKGKTLRQWIEIISAFEHGTNLASLGTDCISRRSAIDALRAMQTYKLFAGDDMLLIDQAGAQTELMLLPPIQPEKEIAKRVLWTGWKGCRNTRYKCPNCKKPVKNDDIYCHRCGQKLMFPHISFTDYVPGEKQETIVRWDDECFNQQTGGD